MSGIDWAGRRAPWRVAEAARQPLLDEIGHLREQLEAADKRNGELAAENAVLSDRLEVKEGEIREYERSMENANKEIRRLREELAAIEGGEDER